MYDREHLVLPAKPAYRWVYYWNSFLLPLHFCFPRLFPNRQRCIIAVWMVVAILLWIPKLTFLIVCGSFFWKKKITSLWTSCSVMAQGWYKHRLDANPTAREVYKTSSSSIIIVDSLYDMFLPSSSSSSSSSGTKESVVVFLFIPGALIDARAYAGICYKMSQQQNVVVILLHTDQYYRLPLPFFGFDENMIQNIMKHVTKQLVQQGYNSSSDIRYWCIGGHSLGARTAQELIPKLPQMRKLVQWGVYSPLPTASSLEIPELRVTASCDGFRPNNDVQTPTPPQNPLLPHVQQYEVEGGNHSGFGDYPIQTYPKPDGHRTISLKEQHDQVARVTTQFLLS